MSSGNNCTLSVLCTFGRDFLFALAVFAMLVLAITQGRLLFDPMSLLSDATVRTTPQISQSTAAQLAANEVPSAFHPFVGPPNLVTSDLSGPTIAIVLAALLFSAIVAFNLVFVRHLRRVYASSRRSAWREDKISPL